ncbi:hypothetical protein M758_9G054800 [Ceratodon purpureus]|nr:hypothetical protein M758_9G054800 [Ceratodon purpureus]
MWMLRTGNRCFCLEWLELEAHLFRASYSAQLGSFLISSRLCFKLASLELRNNETHIVELHKTGGNNKLKAGKGD